MTEAEWLGCDKPYEMLHFVQGKASERKLRLFACAWCRRLWHLLPDERSRRALETGEQYAEGLVGEDGRRAARESAQRATEDAVAEERWEEAYAARDARKTVELAKDRVVCVDHQYSLQERQQQCAIIHDLFGNPFNPVAIDLTWLAWEGGIIPKLAQAIYEERAFDRLPILADALEEARCTSEELLTHCRAGGEHVRGCWAVDVLLGKE
jgi:hypothetical protein